MIPDPGGDRVPDSNGSPNPSKGSTPSGPGLEKLAQSGPDGELAAAIALATAMVLVDGQSTDGESTMNAGGLRAGGKTEPLGDSLSPALELDTETSGLGSLVAGVTGSRTGYLLPLMLLLTALGLVGLRFVRRNPSET